MEIKTPAQAFRAAREHAYLIHLDDLVSHGKPKYQSHPRLRELDTALADIHEHGTAAEKTMMIAGCCSHPIYSAKYALSRAYTGLLSILPGSGL